MRLIIQYILLILTGWLQAGASLHLKFNGLSLEESLGLNLYEMDFKMYDHANEILDLYIGYLKN